MPVPTNPLKHSLANGEVSYGLWLATAAAIPAEVAALCGFDWLLIDGEHGPNDLGSIIAQLQVIAGLPAHGVVRVPSHDPTLIKQLLDGGAQSFLIPMVNTADQARAIVRAMHYPPEGTRGIGAALARASGFGAIPDYVQTAHDQITIIVQLESQEALDNIEEIAAVDGIDALFFGPADLAADMGHIGKTDVPQVDAALADGFARIKKTGKPAGHLAFSAQGVAQARALGATMIGAGVDVMMLAAALRDLTTTIKGQT